MSDATPLQRPLVMGIINVTPDSFSGDGVLQNNDYAAHALAQAEQMVNDGTDILDIGGESSRPGSVPVSAEEEIRRVVPLVAAIKQKLGNVVIAIDTVKASVAEQALQAGATIINDISALGDPAMGAIVANHKAKIVLMHNRSEASAVSRDAIIGGQYDAPDYAYIVDDVARELAGRVRAAQNVGITDDKIILDPGIGFGKTPQQNIALIAQLGRIVALGFPVLMGVSRKSFIGHVLGTTVDDRLEGTAACVTACVLRGAHIIRVHDIKFMARVVKMAAALRDA
jgi:dihydropteroate synthase